VRKQLVRLVVFLVALVGVVPSAHADVAFDISAWKSCSEDASHVNPWAVEWNTVPETVAPMGVTFAASAALDADGVADGAQTTRRRPAPVEYSDGYKLRNRIHKIASFATLPLFAAEYWMGAYMYAYPDNIKPSLQSAHRTVGISLGALFGVNTVTGVWNLIQARKDPNHKTKRTIHGIAMLAADAGFAIAGLMRPTYPLETFDKYYSQRSTHRTIAVTSMVVAGISYLMMVF
jgi:hypothetical protein